MAVVADDSKLWEDTKLAESFLVCSMYEEALSKSMSVLSEATVASGGLLEDVELIEIKEAAGMVLVQSLKELHRSHDIMQELTKVFYPITAIPVDLFLAGVCIHISEGPTGVQPFVEEFLGKWKCVDSKHYVTVDTHDTLPVDKYMEVVEVYTIVLLGKVLNNIDAAISWVEKAELPEDKQQDLLRKLHSLYSQKIHSMTKLEAHPSSQNVLAASDSSIDSEGANLRQQSILKVFSKEKPCFWLFRPVTLKFGKVRLVMTTGKVLMTCFFCLTVYFIKRKRQTLLRTVTKRIASVRKALVDLWQLAFSYQVNPLAAVQPLPAPTRVT